MIGQISTILFTNFANATALPQSGLLDILGNESLEQFTELLMTGGMMRGDGTFDLSKLEQTEFKDDLKDGIAKLDLDALETIVGGDDNRSGFLSLIKDVRTSVYERSLEDTDVHLHTDVDIFDTDSVVKTNTSKDGRMSILPAVLRRPEMPMTRKHFLNHIEAYIGYPTDQISNIWWNSIHFEKYEAVVDITEQHDVERIVGGVNFEKMPPKETSVEAKLVLGPIHMGSLLDDIISNEAFEYHETKIKECYGDGDDSYSIKTTDTYPIRYRIAALKKLKEVYSSLSPEEQMMTLDKDVDLENITKGITEENLADILNEELNPENTRLKSLQMAIVNQFHSAASDVVSLASDEIEYEYRFGSNEYDANKSVKIQIYKHPNKYTFGAIYGSMDRQPTVTNLTVTSTIEGRSDMAKLMEHIIYGLLEDVHAIYHNIQEMNGDVDKFIHEITINEEENVSNIVTNLIDKQLDSLLGCVESEYVADLKSGSRYGPTFQTLLATEQFRYLPRILVMWFKDHSINLNMTPGDSPVDTFKEYFPFSSFVEAKMMMVPSLSIGDIAQALNTTKQVTSSSKQIELKAAAQLILDHASDASYFLGNHHYLTESPIWMKSNSNDKGSQFERTNQKKPPRNMVFLGSDQDFKWPMIRKIQDASSGNEALDVYSHQYCCASYFRQRLLTLSLESSISGLSRLDIPNGDDELNLKHALKNEKKEPTAPSCCQQITPKLLKMDLDHWRRHTWDDTPSFRNKKRLKERYLVLQKRMLALPKCPNHTEKLMDNFGAAFPSELDVNLMHDTNGIVIQLKKVLPQLEISRMDIHRKWETMINVNMVDGCEETVVTPRIVKTAIMAFELLDEARYKNLNPYNQWLMFAKMFHKLDQIGLQVTVPIEGMNTDLFSIDEEEAITYITRNPNEASSSNIDIHLTRPYARLGFLQALVSRDSIRSLLKTLLDNRYCFDVGRDDLAEANLARKFIGGAANCSSDGKPKRDCYRKRNLYGINQFPREHYLDISVGGPFEHPQCVTDSFFDTDYTSRNQVDNLKATKLSSWPVCLSHDTLVYNSFPFAVDENLRSEDIAELSNVAEVFNRELSSSIVCSHNAMEHPWRRYECSQDDDALYAIEFIRRLKPKIMEKAAKQGDALDSIRHSLLESVIQQFLKKSDHENKQQSRSKLIHDKKSSGNSLSGSRRKRKASTSRQRRSNCSIDASAVTP
eukprot:GHVH01013013.1.p1 GENE.GHVH01013013.1~~GHVH01013013.1.p1  ORF type:complete len:1205 (+),score=180.90 GHVH01013013.1:887-4501(+)